MTWKILSEVKDKGRWKYKVECKCGYVGLRRKDWVNSGRSTECKSCSCKRTALKYGTPNNSKGYGEISGTHYSHIKHTAERRGIEFNVTIEYLWKLFLDQKGKCFYTGRALKISKSIRNNNVDWSKITASVDRIDSNKGYIEGNLQWVHKDINRFKNSYSHDKFIKMCHEVVHGNPEPSLVNDK